MLKIEREYTSDYILYQFIDSHTQNDFSKLVALLKKDISHTYNFIFDFEGVELINKKMIKKLQELYITGVLHSCKMILCGLNGQHKVMLELFSLDNLYYIAKSREDAINLSVKESIDDYNYN